VPDAVRDELTEILAPHMEELVTHSDWSMRLAVVKLHGEIARTGDRPKFLACIKGVLKDDSDYDVRAAAVEALTSCLQAGQFFQCVEEPGGF